MGTSDDYQFLVESVVTGTVARYHIGDHSCIHMTGKTTKIKSEMNFLDIDIKNED
jgi:hypothetical protein